jgi:hypothetical protein
MAKSTIAEDGNRGAFVIYYRDPRSINFFVNTDLVSDETDAPTRKTKSIPGHQRRKGPSDQTPINVTQSTADYLDDPSLKSGNALPGRSIILQTTANADIDATRRFTLVGRAIDFLEWFRTESTYETYVYFSDGGRHTVPPVLAQPEG